MWRDIQRLYRLLSYLIIFAMIFQPVGVALAATTPARQAPQGPADFPDPGRQPAAPASHSAYLPLVRDHYRPPAPIEAVIQPGVGGVIGSPDGSLHITFAPQAVTETITARLEWISAPSLPPDNLAVGGPAFRVSAVTAAGRLVEQFPPLTQITPATETTPAIANLTPRVTIEYRYAAADVWGLDLREYFLYTHASGGAIWQRVPSAADQPAGTLNAEIDRLGEFTPMAPLSSGGLMALSRLAAGETRLALDPDDNLGSGHWPSGALWEGPQAYALAQAIQSRLQQNDCHLGVLITRDAGQQNGFVSRSLRAQQARNFEANLFVTLAFNALTGYPWGFEGDGGVRAWARSGHGQDDVLANQFFANIQSYTGRPHTQGVNHPSLYGEFNDPSQLPASIDYAHIETLFLDHNYDSQVIINNFSLIVDAAYAALAPRLGELGVTCGQSNQPPQAPPLPSPEVLQRLRDLGYQNYLRYGADPVSFSTGNHVVQVPLFRLPGRGGLDVAMALTYNSQDGRSDLFGASWNSSYSVYAQRYSDDSVGVTLADGHMIHFPWNGSQYTPGAGVFERLEKTGDGWKLTLANQTAYIFQETVGGFGILTRVQDLSGNALTFAYDLSGQEAWKDGNPVPRPPLTELRDTANRAITFEHDANSRITAIHLFDGRSYGFAYDGAGNLTGITDPAGKTRAYAYDSRHRLTKEWDPAGILFLQNTYDDRNRVVGQIDASGSTNQLAYDPQQRTTTYTDNQGKTQVYQWDELNRVTGETDGLDQTAHTEYDANYNPLKTTDARGFATAYVYDERGNLLQRTDPVDGTSNYITDLSVWTYNERNQPTSYTNALGYTWTYTYDDQGNLIETLAPNGTRTRATYNAWGAPLTRTDELGRVTAYTYDEAGNLTQTRDALGGLSTWTYDAAGRQTSYTDANGHTVRFAYDANDNLTAITDPRGAVSTFEYDANNLLVRSVDRRGGETRYEYDENLKLTGERDAAGNWTRYTYDANYNRETTTDANNNLTRYCYDENNSLARIQHPNGGETVYAYDENGNLSRVTDAEGGQTRYIYDSMNRVRYQTDAAGNTTEYCYDAEDQLVRLIGPRREVWNYTYDPVGSQTAAIDPYAEITRYEYSPTGSRVAAITPLGFRTDYEYDALDRLTVVRQPLLPGGQRPTTITAYDAVGNVLSVTNPLSHVTAFAYDESDRLVQMTDALGGLTAYVYDAEDNPVRVTNPRGFSVETSYNPVNRPLEVKDAQGGVTKLTYDPVYNLIARADPLGRATRFEYDALNQVTRATDPLGGVTQYQRDRLGRLTRQVDANGNPTQYAYDALGRLTGVTDALDGQTAYTYDPAGNLASITDANGSLTEFEYSLLDQLKREVNPLNHVWEYAYDPDGRLTRRTDALFRATYYTYDSNARLLEVAYGALAEPHMAPVTFAYDLGGNQTQMCDSLGCTANTYDALDRLAVTSDWLGRVLTHTYDAAGNLAGLAYPNGNQVQYSYTPNDWLGAVTDPQGDVATITRNAAGQATRILRPNVTQTDLDYDPAGRLVKLDNHQSVSNAPHSAYQYTLDALGNRTLVEETRLAFDGSPDPVTLLHGYTYDALNRLTAARTTAPQTETAYSFDPVGNRLARSGTELTADPGAPQLPVAPNPVDSAYTYNAANQLLSDGASTFDYNANGDRVQQTETLTTGLTQNTRYAFDREDRLTGVTQAISGTTGLTMTMSAAYVYDGYGRRAIKEVTTFQPLTVTITGTQYLTATQVYTYLYNGLDLIGVQMSTEGISVTSGVSETYFYLAPSPISGLWRPFEMERLPNPAAGFAGDRHWYEADGLDSVTNLTDAAGAVVSPMLYDEYGRILAGDAELQALTFTAQEYDAETGLYYFYARYYDPARGVWVSQDSYRGEPANPLTLSRYSYVINNPIIQVDRDGKFLWVVAIATVALVTVLSTQPVYAPSPNDDIEEMAKRASEEKKKRDAAATDLYLSVICEPYDYASTGARCIKGECTPLDLLGLLPLVPGGAGKASKALRNGDDFVDTSKGLSRYSDTVFDVTKKDELLDPKSWQNAEELLEDKLDVAKNTQKYFVEGMTKPRIPDFITDTYIADSKFYKNSTLSSNEQLRDFVRLAKDENKPLYIYITQNAHVTDEALDLIRSTGGDIKRVFK